MRTPTDKPRVERTVPFVRNNFFAGWADTLSFGLTKALRTDIGYNDAVNQNSSAYSTGVFVGTLHNIALGFGTAGGMLGVAQQGLNFLGLADGNQIGRIADLRLGYHSYGLYAQDSWKITRRLTFRIR